MSKEVKLGTSGSGQFDINDVWAVGRISLIVGACAALVHFAENLSSIDFGVWNALLVPAAVAGLTTLARWLKDYTKKPA